MSSGGGGSRPVILIDAGIHAREWIAPAAALYVINQLVENAAESALTDSVDWHIIPVLNPDGYEHKVYRLVPTEQQLKIMSQLRNNPSLDFWSGALRAGHPVDVRVPPRMHGNIQAFLNRQGVLHHVIINDLQQVLEKEQNQTLVKPINSRDETRVSFTKYQRYDDIRKYLSQLESSYPRTVTVQSIGNTSEGRPIDIIQISSGGGGTRPVILIDAGIHAREWIAPAAALYVINQLVENATASSLTDSVDWHIIPVLNPDGYEYSLTKDRMWRKTKSRQSSSCLGVDANRNFGFHWNEIGASNYPCSELYAGPHAFSEPETQAFRDYVLKNSKRIKLYLTFHSYGPHILYPWGYTSKLPDDWKTLDALASKANEAQMAAGGPKYGVGSSTNVLYAAAGGSDDWIKSVGGVALSYTIEFPGGGSMGFFPPASDILKIVTQFFEAVRVYGKYVADNYG
ncbi:carboxypeptidase B-like [Schistocerca serialis cubense]|uniref:carboxypeptidase B-like n=1 Tax=Schistocerca serialis cubense TaxID=2023355 RepID=UPI00214E4ACA|nr:carboxypeptidase B-like [Schistocerca serialis cubense]